MTENSTVFVVDDDPGALESLRWMLEQADFRVKAFSSSREFLDSYRPEETGCLVLDVRMPGMDGMELQEILRSRKIRLPIIFMTAYGDVPTCARAFRGGAIDFLEKPVNDKVLLEHIERLIAQEEHRRNNSGDNRFGDRVSRLTPTETEVLKALIEGRSIKEIARARKVSVQTIWRHQMNIFQKIGVESHVELVRVATQWQLQQGQQAPHADQ
ncbi:MAG: response regulator [Thermoguttaceae bacterium]|jgi:FixJ family two-component response regulator